MPNEGKLEALLPVSIAGDEKISAAARACDHELSVIDQNINAVYILSRIDELPEPVLDLLAWQFHVEGYDLARTVEEKRSLVKSAIELHRYKGTPWAVRGGLAKLGIDAELSEWFEYAGDFYRFRIYLRSQATESTYDLVLALIETLKNVRSWLDFIGIHREFSNYMHTGLILKKGKKYEIGLHFSTEIALTTLPVAGFVRRARSTSISIGYPSLNISQGNFFVAGSLRYARKTTIGVSHG